MSRATAVTDRLVVAVVGLSLAAAGALAAAWRTGWAERWWPAGPTGDGWGDRLPAADVAGLVAQPWWPWACAGTAVVLVLLGLRWFVAHLPGRADRRLELDGADDRAGQGGRLRADLGALADAAASDLAGQDAVRSASGRVVQAGRRRALDLVATVDPRTDLAEVRRAVAATAGRLEQAVGGAVPLRVRVHVARVRTERARRVV